MFDPWGILDHLPGWRVDWVWAPRQRGLTHFGARIIILDAGLTRRDERCVLSQELVHAERGPFPRWMRPREEQLVAAIAARRLIPLRDLGEALAWSLDCRTVADELDAMPDLGRPRGQWLLEHPRGDAGSRDRWALRNNVIVPAAAKAGLGPVTTHDLRHTAASLAIAAGADVKMVQAMLGHASATLTMDTYGHLWAGLDSLADRMETMVHPK